MTEAPSPDEVSTDARPSDESESWMARRHAAESSEPTGDGRQGLNAPSPDEVEAHQFSVSVRGYDVEEVQSFLKVVADRYREALDTIADLEASTPQDPYESLGAEVAEVLSSARRTADKLKADANQEAESLRSQALEAVEEAIRLRDEAEREASELVTAAHESAEAELAQVRESASSVERLRQKLQEERQMLQQTVDRYARLLGQVRRDTADAQVGATNLLREVLIRLEELETVETNLVARLEGARSALGELSEPEAVEEEQEVDAEPVG
jgi:DivIVA domain-containing protein